MPQKTPFQPFQDRLSRDIRNDLSSSLVQCLHNNDLEPARQVAQRYLEHQPAQYYVSYINDRIQRYQRALRQLAGKSGEPDPIQHSLVLWDLELFFEVHEVLEHAWYNAVGEHKLVLQALIRAAGVYIKLEYGYIEQAAKIGAKAIRVLEKNKATLAGYFPPERLIDGLKTLSPAPPKLLAP